jgi:integration host factor subunit alpha
MTKADIAKELYERNYKWLSRKEASDMVGLLITTLKENIADGKMIKIAGFGTFIVRKKAERKGRNLKTGEEIPIAPRKVVTFKASNQFKADASHFYW